MRSEPSNNEAMLLLIITCRLWRRSRSPSKVRVSEEYRVCPIDGSVHLDAERAKFIVEKVRLRVLPECEP